MRIIRIIGGSLLLIVGIVVLILCLLTLVDIAVDTRHYGLALMFLFFGTVSAFLLAGWGLSMLFNGITNWTSDEYAY